MRKLLLQRWTDDQVGGNDRKGKEALEDTALPGMAWVRVMRGSKVQEHGGIICREAERANRPQPWGSACARSCPVQRGQEPF